MCLPAAGPRTLLCSWLVGWHLRRPWQFMLSTRPRPGSALSWEAQLYTTLPRTLPLGNNYIWKIADCFMDAWSVSYVMSCPFHLTFLSVVDFFIHKNDFFRLNIFLLYNQVSWRSPECCTKCYTQSIRCRAEVKIPYRNTLWTLGRTCIHKHVNQMYMYRTLRITKC